MAQTSFGFSGRFCPMIRPLFHGSLPLGWKLQHSVTDMVVSSRADHSLLNANIELANIDTRLSALGGKRTVMLESPSIVSRSSSNLFGGKWKWSTTALVNE